MSDNELDQIEDIMADVNLAGDIALQIEQYFHNEIEPGDDAISINSADLSDEEDDFNFYIYNLTRVRQYPMVRQSIFDSLDGLPLIYEVFKTEVQDQWNDVSIYPTRLYSEPNLFKMFLNLFTEKMIDRTMRNHKMSWSILGEVVKSSFIQEGYFDVTHFDEIMDIRWKKISPHNQLLFFFRGTYGSPSLIYEACSTLETSLLCPGLNLIAQRTVCPTSEGYSIIDYLDKYFPTFDKSSKNHLRFIKRSHVPKGWVKLVARHYLAKMFSNQLAKRLVAEFDTQTWYDLMYTKLTFLSIVKTKEIIRILLE
jgi:hypothetical protein